MIQTTLLRDAEHPGAGRHAIIANKDAALGTWRQHVRNLFDRGRCRTKHRWLLWCVVALIAAIAPACARPPDVRLIRSGPVWRLANGVVELAFDTDGVYVSEFLFRGGSNVLQPYGLYLDCDVPEGYRHFARSENPWVEKPRVVTQSRDCVEVALRERVYDARSKRLYPLVFDHHLVLQRGDAGFYSYVVLKHAPGGGVQPLAQTRLVLRAADRFTDYAQSTSRIGHLKDHPWKYTLSLPWADVKALGLVDPRAKEAVWAVFPQPFWCRGPDQRELTLHEGPYVLAMFEGGHYGTFPTSRPQGAMIGEGWSKVCGPVFYMLTRGANSATMWRRAAARGKRDERRWPPRWLARRIGPLTTVTGRIAPNPIRDPVRVVLKNDRYVFWDTVHPGAPFTLRNVLAGEYTMLARQGGLASTTAKTVIVSGGKSNAGLVRLIPSMPTGKLLWEIGRLDDSCLEFAGSRHCLEFNGIAAYARERAEPLIYTIGKSRPERDWYWLQPGPGDSVAGSRVPPWEIRFDLESPPSRPLMLHLVFADALSAYHLPPPTFRVDVNGRHAASFDLGEGGQAGSYCVAPVGVPQHYRVTLSPDAFTAGTNRIVLYPEAGGYVMYDYVALQDIPH